MVDGHGPHYHVKLVDKVVTEQIILVELPSCTSHWLQPLDGTVFFSLKTKYNEA